MDRQVIAAFLPIAAAALAAGCAVGPPPSAMHTVRGATADQVATCAYVADVNGIEAEEMYPRPGSGKERARIYALNKAEEVGATHMVWGRSGREGHGVSVVSGVAYRCR